MIGVLIGDMIGSRFEFKSPEQHDYPLFDEKCRYTDDSVLTIAIIDALLGKRDYASKLREYFAKYPYKGYGRMFSQWASSSSTLPYNSFGNGGPMRVAPVAYISNKEQYVLEEAKKSTECTHNHPEAIKGSMAITCAVWMCRNGAKKKYIKAQMEKRFGYDLTKPIIFPFAYIKGYNGTSSQEAVPRALQAFLTSQNFEDAIRRAIAIGGDSDTIAAMTGGIAEAYYGIPKELEARMYCLIPSSFAFLLEKFYKKYVNRTYTMPIEIVVNDRDYLRDIFFRDVLCEAW